MVLLYNDLAEKLEKCAYKCYYILTTVTTFGAYEKGIPRSSAELSM